MSGPGTLCRFAFLADVTRRMGGENVEHRNVLGGENMEHREVVSNV